MAEYVDMPTTIWTDILNARRGGREAMDRILRKYRPPLLAFVLHARFGPEDAEDIVQQIFLTIHEDDVLLKADKARGRFRSLLLAVTRHTLSAKRRHDARLKHGGCIQEYSIDARVAQDGRFSFEEFLSAPETDEGFDILWIQNLVRVGLDHLREECEGNRTPDFRALFHVTNDGLGYEQVADRLGAKVTDIKNWVFRARSRLKELVKKEIREYSSSRAEYDSEVAYLLKFVQ